MKRAKSPWHALIAAGILVLTAVVVGGGCSGGENFGTCFFRCDQESSGISLYGCKPTTKPDDDCAAIAKDFCLTIGTTAGRQQFEGDCFPDCQSATSCANCAPSWHNKMCVEGDDAGDGASSEGASSDGETTDVSDDSVAEVVEASAEAADDAAADDATVE